MKSSLTSRQILVLLAGFLVLFIGGGARFSIGLTLRPMVEEFGWGRSVLGQAVAVFQIVSAVCMFLAGRAADRMSPRAVLTGGVIIGGITIASMAFVTQPWHVVVLYGVLFGIGNGTASLTPVGVMVTRAFPGRTGAANGFVTSGMSVGQLVIVAILSAILVTVGWRSVFVWVGAAHALLLPLVLFAAPGSRDAAAAGPDTRTGMTIAEAARTRQFWLLLGVYAVCGFDDFFVSTHVVAFAQDRGFNAYIAGNLLALMGVAGLIGVLVAGVWGDRSGPVPATAWCFAARIAVFGLVVVNQSPLSVAIYALVFGVTFLMTAPLTVLFVRDAFGTKHLGAISGLITMVHHTCGGLGAYLGAVIFDHTGRYDAAFATMFAASTVALGLTLLMRRKPSFSTIPA